MAAGLAPLAVGTETDGSIVCPASACGIVGIKPTLGLVSRHGIVPISAAQDTAGPMARSVADAAALLSVLAAADPADPATEPAAGQPADYTAFLDPGALAGARLGVWRDGCQAAGQATLAVLDAALALLREQGATCIDPVELPGAATWSGPEFAALLHEFKHDLNAYLAALPGPRPRSWPSSSSTTSERGRRCWPTSARNCSSRPRPPAGTWPTRPRGPPGRRRGRGPGRRWTARWPRTGSTPSSR